MKKKSTKPRKSKSSKSTSKKNSKIVAITSSTSNFNTKIILSFSSLFLGILLLIYKQNPNSTQLIGLLLDAISLRFFGIIGTEFLPYFFLVFGLVILVEKKSKFEKFIFLSIVFQLVSLIHFQNLNSVRLLDTKTQLGYIGSFIYNGSIVLFDHKVSRLFWFMTLFVSIILTSKNLLIYFKKSIYFLLKQIKSFITNLTNEINVNNDSIPFQRKLIHFLFFQKKQIRYYEQNNPSYLDDIKIEKRSSPSLNNPNNHHSISEIKSTIIPNTFNLPKSLSNISQPILDNPLENTTLVNPLDETISETITTEPESEIEPIQDENNSHEITTTEKSPPSNVIDPPSPTLNTTPNRIDSTYEDYQYPPITFLNQSSTKPDSIKNQTKKRVEQAAILEEALQSFNVKAKVVNITPGPSVTRFELQPGEGVKISKITGLSKDIALKLAAPDIRIEAPIPGKALIGIEVPNANIQMITLRSIMEETDFYSKPTLSAGMGKTITGDCILMDLAKMPHVLIAGATGSGKSVCINTIILSILMKVHPDDVKFLMIDPKKVELSLYEGIPHLIAPVVTDPNKAAATLKKWALVEMERRYEIFSKVGVKDLAGFNNFVKENEEKIELGKDLNNAEDTSEDTYKKMPYIVVIIDELADLMMVASQDVEQTICRLAQMARATGIHLVIATQRPSVNVVTGLIKANVPSRISFYLQSQIDSRTILDIGGAEKLMGKGDMLYSPSGTFKPTRVQGVFVSEEEVKKVVSHLKEQKKPDYLSEIIEVEPLAKDDTQGKKDSQTDELFEDAKQLIINTKYASTSYLQRKLRIGYNRAARIMDELEAKGVISEYVGEKKARSVG